MKLELKIVSEYAEEENLFTKYAQARKRGDTAEAERLSKIIENNALTAKLYCKKKRIAKEPKLTKQCGICGKPIREDLGFCSSSCIREYRARKDKNEF